MKLLAAGDVDARRASGRGLSGYKVQADEYQLILRKFGYSCCLLKRCRVGAARAERELGDDSEVKERRGELYYSRIGGGSNL